MKASEAVAPNDLEETGIAIKIDQRVKSTVKRGKEVGFLNPDCKAMARDWNHTPRWHNSDRWQPCFVRKAVIGEIPYASYKCWSWLAR